jgi:hypothetical protein
MSCFIHCYAECRYAECRNAECRNAECRVLFIVLLSVGILNVVMLSVETPCCLSLKLLHIYTFTLRCIYMSDLVMRFQLSGS